MRSDATPPSLSRSQARLAINSESRFMRCFSTNTVAPPSSYLPPWNRASSISPVDQELDSSKEATVTVKECFKATFPAGVTVAVDFKLAVDSVLDVAISRICLLWIPMIGGKEERFYGGPEFFLAGLSLEPLCEDLTLVPVPRLGFKLILPNAPEPRPQDAFRTLPHPKDRAHSGRLLQSGNCVAISAVATANTTTLGASCSCQREPADFKHPCDKTIAIHVLSTAGILPSDGTSSFLRDRIGPYLELAHISTTYSLIHDRVKLYFALAVVRSYETFYRHIRILSFVDDLFPPSFLFAMFASKQTMVISA
ncbi:hypothetical protein SCHPADRAFT_992498 [Schizopora paradoxa]|uniref:Uncharacterized protein n=1 Tax=Schizopora paradoxa TaxID=27342 RepID=A0A0H2SS34_9AGAM|nr:hypothetical protein SCHPADRAFT_992498 [Schizopora paradoxa]